MTGGNIFDLYKGRSLILTKPVFIYRNLHDRDGTKRYSIMQKGLVVAHASRIMLRDCKFVVRNYGRKQCLLTRRKCVHAFCKGYIIASVMGISAEENNKLPARILYRAYNFPFFFTTNLTGKPQRVNGARVCLFNNNGCTGAYLS